MSSDTTRYTGDYPDPALFAGVETPPGMAAFEAAGRSLNAIKTRIEHVARNWRQPLHPEDGPSDLKDLLNAFVAASADYVAASVKLAIETHGEELCADLAAISSHDAGAGEGAAS